MITDVPLEIGYFGIAPGTVGVYQANCRMSAELSDGPAWIHLQRVANCGPPPPRGTNLCGNGIQMDDSAWILLYE